MARLCYLLFILTPLLAVVHWFGGPIAWEWVLLPWYGLVGLMLAAVLFYLIRDIDPFAPKDNHDLQVPRPPRR